ncbi:MAG: hypothetical protein D6748_02430 [Calditrichaeota bacterium]|nr:MAG: hypothetical protein D6748_02430 [Calditrichota bacterium]
MKINSLENFGYIVSVDRVKMAKQAQKQHSETDKLELSDEAKQLNKTGSSLTPERIDLIRQRIAENFYDQDDVLNEVAERLLKSRELREFLNNLRPDNFS